MPASIIASPCVGDRKRNLETAEEPVFSRAWGWEHAEEHGRRDSEEKSRSELSTGRDARRTTIINPDAFSFFLIYAQGQ